MKMDMKGLRILALVFVAALAVSAVGVSSASADIEFCSVALVLKMGKWEKSSGVFPDKCETATTTGDFELYEGAFLLALWLEGSVAVSAILPVESEGELELVSLNGGGLGVVVKVLCSGILDGWVGPESLDFISELLTLGKVAVPLAELTGTALLCTNISGCTEPEVWAAKLGWETEVELYELLNNEGSVFVDLIFNGGWYAQCLLLGITTSETCSAAETAVKLTNEANGTVDGEFSDLFQEEAGLKLANCTAGGAETGEVNGLGITLETGVTLSVSSE